MTPEKYGSFELGVFLAPVGNRIEFLGHTSPSPVTIQTALFLIIFRVSNLYSNQNRCVHFRKQGLSSSDTAVPPAMT
jgi:hypothetical protein